MNAALRSLLAVLLAPISVNALTPAHSATLDALRREAARDVALAAAGSPAMTKDNAGASFDGSAEVPFHVIRLNPVGYANIPGTGSGEEVKLEKPVERDQDRLGRRKAAEEAGKDPDAAEDAIETDATPDKSGNPSFHFVGKRIPNLGVVTYTPVADAPGDEGGTEVPAKGSDWRSWAPKAMLAGGIAATIGGFFFPPLLFLGGALLGAWGMLKLISAKTGGD